MKAVFDILAATIFLAVTPNLCFAAWDIEIVSKERAKELGMQVRTTADGPNHVIVRLEFRTEGELKGFSRIDLRIGEGDDAPLQADRSKPGRASVGFAADRARLAKITLSVMVPGGLGGAVYQLRLSDVVGPEKGR